MCARRSFVNVSEFRLENEEDPPSRIAGLQHNKHTLEAGGLKRAGAGYHKLGRVFVHSRRNLAFSWPDRILLITRIGCLFAGSNVFRWCKKCWFVLKCNLG
jgi:hypothetical protein